MKLVLSIVSDEDTHKVMGKLNAKGYSVTKLCSTGGFLRSGNTTLMIGVKEEDVEQVIGIIRNESKSRKKYINAPASPDTIGGVHSISPVEVVVGGATVFVMDVERFEKL